VRRLLIVAAVLAAVVLLGGVAIVVAAVVRGTSVALPIPPTLKPEECTIKAGQDTATLTLEQGQHAATIAAVGLQRGDGVRGVTIALATALQESKLENIPGGDRDSIGLFQQRPSQGWGTPEQLADPRFAATAFYKKLETIDNWQTKTVAEAAQAVQRSADGSLYGGWEFRATTLATAYSGQSAGAVACLTRNAHATKDLATALRADLRGDLGTKAVSIALSTPNAAGIASLHIASKTSSDIKTYRQIEYWLVGHAQAYRVASVNYRDVMWTATTGGWQTLAKPDATGRIVVKFS
jgi:hypothetical protein